MTDEQWDVVIGDGLTGYFRSAREAARRMLPRLDRVRDFDRGAQRDRQWSRLRFAGCWDWLAHPIR